MTPFEAAVLANQKMVFTALLELQNRIEEVEFRLGYKGEESVITHEWYENIRKEFDSQID